MAFPEVNMPAEPQTSVIVFPFDALGATGCGQGALLLADVLQELIDDNEQETRPMRAQSYQGKIKINEIAFNTAKKLSSWRSLGKQIVRQCLRSKDRIIWLGGDHLSILPIYDELGGSTQSAKTLIVQFDAHLDIQQWHDVGTNPTNGNFLLHLDEATPEIMNIGHRDMMLLPKDIDQYYSAAYSALDVGLREQQIADEIRKRAKSAKSVWIDIDVDVFDPAAMPGVQTPMPFGPNSLSVLKLLDAAFAGNVIGISISEFDPARDPNSIGVNLLGWLLEWFLLRWYEQRDDED